MSGLPALVSFLLSVCVSLSGPAVPAADNPSGDRTESAYAQDAALAEDLPGYCYEDKLFALMPKDENYMVSPFSLKAAFALAANGAAGETRDEILAAFDYESLDAYNQAVRAVTDKSAAGESTVFEVSNAVWLNTDKAQFTFQRAYTKAVSDLFGAQAGTVTDRSAVETVNAWANEKTHGKIKEIIHDSDFAALLANAVYFNGKWNVPFSGDATTDDLFTCRDGTCHTVPFMRQTGWFEYSETDGARLLSMPYRRDRDGLQADMVLVLPGEKEVRPNALLEKAEWKRTYVSVKLPKFELECAFQLNSVVKALGIHQSFDATEADFTPMFGLKYAFLDTVLQNTYLRVDEEGTEAAAVTALAMAGSAMPTELPKPILFHADRPFTFLIRDCESGEILFMGEYAYAA